MPESYFSWYLVAVDGPDVAQTWLMKTSKKWNRDCNDKYPAFTLGELMRMLPPNTEIIAQVDSDRIKGGAMVISPDNERVLSDTPEDAAALLIIELIKSGEITSLHVSA